MNPTAASVSTKRTLLRLARFRVAIAGAALSLVIMVLLSGVLVLVRDRISVATSALVLVIPVVAGVAIGGFWTGIFAMVTGFLTYDFLFIPPYYTLSVGAGQNWVALGVYAMVMVIVSKLVSDRTAARAAAQLSSSEARRLFELSELLVGDYSEETLLGSIVETVVRVFDLSWAALMLPVEGELTIVASAGEAPDHDLLKRTALSDHVQMDLLQQTGVQTLALATAGRGVGLLVVGGLGGPWLERDFLVAFANHLALVVERAELRTQAIRARSLEEIDRLRRSLVGAVSHDLRTPLATIKLAATTLIETGSASADSTAEELLNMIDLQADRLERLVSNLLDMTRIESGVLDLDRSEASVVELAEEACVVLGGLLEADRVEFDCTPPPPQVYVDRVLIRQALANLIDNAIRYSPEGSKVTISARPNLAGWVEVSVSDLGPGIPKPQRMNIFEVMSRTESGGRGGLGLAIVQAFVEVHGGKLRIEDGPTGGTTFIFTLPAASK